MKTNRTRSSRALRDQIVGKCIAGVVARPGRNGEPPTVMMLQFDDGSVVEFITPRSDRLLRAAAARSARSGSPRPTHEAGPDQLALAAI
ncbi:MAG: hypothetical protein RQ847_02300 [Wenzhouxiangellaceae bacterium]|nr:hypothetical protein [Wenzhouxiangellaceae bacterium]